MDNTHRLSQMSEERRQAAGTLLAQARRMKAAGGVDLPLDSHPLVVSSFYPFVLIVSRSRIRDRRLIDCLLYRHMFKRWRPRLRPLSGEIPRWPAPGPARPRLRHGARI